jgi:alcohol-forming fatty acyl-CoA reductase
MVFYHCCTAYVSGDRAGLIMEKPIRPGESLRDGTHLDIDAELRLVREVKNEIADRDDAQKTKERKAMKELGVQRARHFGWSNTYVCIHQGHGRDAAWAAPWRHARGDHAA